jgi:cephalosporin-C deacetylase-like acetyl esterase
MTKKYSASLLAFTALLLLTLHHSRAAAAAPNPWDLKALSQAPKFTDDPTHSADGVKALFFDAVSWKGQPTRVFAYYGAPKVQAGTRVPGMVLVHGGGGSAFIPWVKLWVSRGYAAIAMDTCGAVSGGGFNNHPRDPQGGPPGWGGFDQIDEPVTDQWTYHAVADVILAHSLLRSFPEVDPNKTGITGISWGGYLTCIVAGVDNRFKFAAPVYGCGFLGEDSAWLPDFQKMGPEKAAKWLSLWDPAVYLPNARMPMLWVDGTNDFAYPPDSLQKSYRLPKGPRTLAMRVRMVHAHGGPGENPEEIHAMADAILRGQTPLDRITKAGQDGTTAWATYSGASPILSAELNYTTDSGEWQKRNWQTVPATLDAAHTRVSAELPAGVTAYYFNLTDMRGLILSTEHVTLPPR